MAISVSSLGGKGETGARKRTKSMRLKIKIAYDGRPFNGWQSQACGNTVQDNILRALEQVAKQPVKLHGSGRTDTGVHALGQIGQHVFLASA